MPPGAFKTLFSSLKFKAIALSYLEELLTPTTARQTQTVVEQPIQNHLMSKESVQCLRLEDSLKFKLRVGRVLDTAASESLVSSVRGGVKTLVSAV